MKKKSATYLLGLLLAGSLSLNIMAFKEKAGTPKAQNKCADPCSRPYPGLPLSTVQKMVREYGTNQSAFINNAVITGANRDQTALASAFTYKDARSVYFEMDTIKQFICTIESKMLEKNLKKTNGEPIEKCDLGIKFYYAAYANTKGAKTQKLLDSYAGKHTLVLAATYRDSDGKIKVFDPYYADAANHPVSIQTFIQNQNTNVQIHMLAVAVTTGTNGIIARNHGELCPPPRDCEDPLY